MKIILPLAALIFLCLPMHLFAQNGRWVLGLEGGAGRANVIGNSIITEFNKDRLGYTLGLTVQYKFSKILSLKSGINYERKGYRDERDLTIYDSLLNPPLGTFEYRLTSNFNYLTVPLLLRATFGSRLNFFVNAGPYFSFLLSQNEKIEATKYFAAATIDHSSYYKNVDLGFAAGAGVGYPINERLGLSLEARYHQGLLNASQYFLIGGTPIHHSVTHVLLGLSYSLGASKEKQ